MINKIECLSHGTWCPCPRTCPCYRGDKCDDNGKRVTEKWEKNAPK